MPFSFLPQLAHTASARAAAREPMRVGWSALAARTWRRRIEKGVLGLVAATGISAGQQPVEVLAPIERQQPVAGEDAQLWDLVAQGPTASALLAGDDVYQLHRLVAVWADAWAKQDVDRYLSFYSEDFQPTGRYASYTSGEWRLSRRDRLRNPETIRIDVSGVRVELDGANALVRFDQSYSSDSYSDHVSKELATRREEGGWRIVREESLPR
ncbi:MAG: hypothetical protein DWQ36_23455 [Acidobacteria bacterium]|nr:MAG: hypothetical protein DWQ30_21740 [Acidobacteriota bacterium]REK00116.1 MAG: hypothetical protein DWQ36_23455 [Acidobacteriota bacterium]